MRKTLFVFALVVTCVSLASPLTHGKKHRKSTTSSRAALESQITSILKKDKEYQNNEFFHTAFQYIDLNKDGVDEIIVTIDNGSNNPDWKIYKTQPLTEIGWGGGCNFKVLKTTHNGYLDLESWWHMSASETPSTFYHWNGVKYQEVK